MKKYFALITFMVLASCAQQNAEPEAAINAVQNTAAAKTETSGTFASNAAKEESQAMNKLLFPSKLNEQAPEKFQVKLNTTKGEVILDVTRAWAPNGADRFYNLIKNGYFTDIAFFRVISGFMAQFGIHGDPQVSSMWREANIADDPVKVSNSRGMVSFATAGPDTRTTQLFINYGDNSFLDGQGFSPFAKVSKGMEAIDNLYSGYGEGQPSGNGPNQGAIQMQGNAYLQKYFTKLDYIKSAEIL